MKIAIVHNEYGKFSGEEAVVAGQIELLTGQNHSVVRFTRSSAEISTMFLGQLQAFFCGIYNPFARKKFRAFLQQQKPDIVHIHNLYPLISPAILSVCREMGLPVVMTVHNYRLICPNGLFMSKGEICECCRGGREYWCVLKNCEDSFTKSLGYALRNAVARWMNLYLDNVNILAVLTKFQGKKLIEQGFAPERIVVVPNMSPFVGEGNDQPGDYIGYVGRISPEKGVSTLIEVAGQYPQILFKAAGNYEKCPELLDFTSNNFQFLGQLNREAVFDFFVESRVIVLCSTWYEGFPMILIEAMLHGKPVIASRLGGIPEIVDDGKTGLLFEAGNAVDLAEKIKYLWDNPQLCRRMGEAGREKALREYSSEKYYQRLMKVYEKAMGNRFEMRVES